MTAMTRRAAAAARSGRCWASLRPRPRPARGSKAGGEAERLRAARGCCRAGPPWSTAGAPLAHRAARRHTRPRPREAGAPKPCPRCPSCALRGWAAGLGAVPSAAAGIRSARRRPAPRQVRAILTVRSACSACSLGVLPWGPWHPVAMKEQPTSVEPRSSPPAPRSPDRRSGARGCWTIARGPWLLGPLLVSRGQLL